MYAQCCHIMPTGRKCQSPALRNNFFCYFHLRLHTIRDAPPRKDGAIRLPVPEDSSSVLLALAQVFKDLGSERLDARRAGLFLYGLQIASQITTQQDKRRTTFDDRTAIMVESIGHTREGAEIGPRIFVCHDIKDCNDCPERYDCADAEGVKPMEEDKNEPETCAPGRQLKHPPNPEPIARSSRTAPPPGTKAALATPREPPHPARLA